MDLAHPSTAQGWELAERMSLMERHLPKLILALAIVHHLRISAQIPLIRQAEWLARIAPALIIEFVDKGDPKVQKMLINRKDVFHDYNQAGFEEAFQHHFDILQMHSMTTRTLYRMKRKS